MQIDLLPETNPLVLARDFTGDNPVNVMASAYPWSVECKHYKTAEGRTIRQIVDDLLPPSAQCLITYVYVNEVLIPHTMYERVRPKAGATISIKIVPAKSGGKSPLKMVLMVAVIALSAWTGFAATGALAAAGYGATAAAVGGALASAAVSIVGNLLIAALVPPPKQRLSDGSQDSATLFIEGARNQIDPYGVVPVVLGKHKYVPKLCANNYSLTSGNDQYARQMFCWGLGKYYVDNYKIGETPLSRFDGVTVEHFLNGQGKDAVTSIYPGSVYQEDLAIQLKHADSWQIRTTQPGADEVKVDITMPEGLVSYNNKKGFKESAYVSYAIKIAPKGTTAFIVDTAYGVTGYQTSAIRKSYTFKLPGGQYDVWVRRVTGDDSSDKVSDKTYWSALRTITYENPINIDGLSFSVMQILATDQLNGAVDQLSGDVFSIVPDWNPATNSWIERTTKNPASLFKMVAQNSPLFNGSLDSPNARPLANARVDMDALEDWHEYCTAKGFEYNGVFDYETSVWDALTEIASAGCAVPTLVDGKWSVVIDRVQDVIAQHFTPANSFDYRATKIFPEIPHALRIQFINEEIDYLQDEYLVYDDGYSEANATIITGLQLAGITKPSLIYFYARRYLAMMRLRPIEHSFNVDLEHLIASKGSRIKFAHDVALIGLDQGRVTEVIYNDNMIVGVILDKDVTMEEGKTYNLRFRLNDTNESLLKNVTTTPGYSDVLMFDEPFPSYIQLESGCLFMFGETGRETIDLVIRDIVPDKDFRANLICLDYAPEIQSAADGPIPPFESQTSLPPEFARPVAPVIKAIQTGSEVQIRNLDGSISSRMVITLENNNAFDVIPVVKIKPSSADDYEYAHTIKADAGQIVIEGLQEYERYDMQIYYKKALSGSITGVGGNVYSPIITQNLVLFQGVQDDPPTVQNFELQLIGTLASLTWDDPQMIDFNNFEIRFSPELTNVNWSTSYAIKVDVKGTETVIAYNQGTYLIKAFDRGGRQSQFAAVVVADALIEGYNAVENIVESPTFAGAKNGVVIEDNRLVLSDVSQTDGVYTFANAMDFGGIYKARVVPRIVAGGENVTNTLDSWPTLDRLSSLAGSAPADWSVRVEVRYTLDNPAINPIWTDWNPIIAGDYTFWKMEFRLVLVGNGTNITPAVEEVSMLVDMEDRIIKGDNVAIAIGGTTVTYNDSFKVKPTLLVTQTNQQNGDVLVILEEAPDHFRIKYTNAGVDVARTINYHAIGYGRLTV